MSDGTPKCKSCGSQLKWDFCQDTYQILNDKGEWVFGENQYFGTEDDVAIHFCTCGEVLSVSEFLDGMTLDVHAPADVAWDEIDTDC